jgi:archaellin
MIELIFALVIMAIVMMSAPMLISTASKSSSTAMQQEGINEASSRINMIMGYAWDENNTNSTYTPILHTTAGHADLAMVALTSRRKGTPNQSQRTFIFADANSSNLFTSLPINLGFDAGETVEADVDDIDDFIGDINLTQIGAASTDYIEKATININTAIRYISDVTTNDYGRRIITHTAFTPMPLITDDSNIKEIVVTLTSTDITNATILEKTIVLRAFSCNIGTYNLKERSF